MGRYRVTIQEAAERLGVKETAIRKRIERGTLKKEKGEDGRVYVFVDEPPVEDRDKTHDEGYDAYHPAGYDALIKSQQERIQDLREQLSAEREANRENRRIIAALMSRIPELEAPASPEPRESPTAATEEPVEPTPSEPTGGPQEPTEQPWWRRMFGG